MGLRRIAPGLACIVVAAACGGSGGTATGDGGHTSDTGTNAPDAAKDSGADVAPAAPLCTVASKGTSGVLLTGRLLLPTGPTTGELLIGSTGTIACAAASCASTTGYASATHIACAGGVISPGLVNAHDHTEYATEAPPAHGKVRYDCRGDWRVGEEGFAALPDKSTTSASVIAAQELRLVLGGGTSVVGTGGVQGLARNLAEYKDTSWLGGLTGQSVYFDTFPLGDDEGAGDGVLITSGCAYPDIISPTDAFESGVFAPHFAEGVNLAAENEIHCGASNGLLTKQTSIIHGVAVNATDVAGIATAGSKIIWSPRSNISLYGDTTPLTEYRYAGITIALGTDWLPSGSMNMLRELACADSFNTKYFAGTFSDQDLFEMATINAAAAAGFDSQIGSLVAGKVADVAVFDGRTNADYRAVIAAEDDDVHLVLRGGAVLYGDTAIVSALASGAPGAASGSSGCTAITVCGEARSVCLDVPTVTLEDVEQAASTIYTLFSCSGQTPPGEPTCIPYRDTYPNGISATDRDGDGVPDKDDDCPDIWNPIRLMDGAKQSDVNGNGIGDACDPHPVSP
jgi:hypothetical protein